jgi:hypothetical protein
MEGWSASDVFMLLLGVVVSVSGWFLRTLHDNHVRLAAKVNDHHVHAAHMYVRRDDYRADMSEIKSMLQHISQKIDDKADK